MKYLKASLLLMTGAMAALIAWTNIRYPAANIAYISHTLMMDTVTRGTHQSRAIDSPALVTFAHKLITATEAITGLLCLLGGVLYPFHPLGRLIGLAGLTGGLAVWFFGFRVIAGEYFCGWQSDRWNGLPDAHRIAGMLGVIWVIVK